jgi:hypothetical protein
MGARKILSVGFTVPGNSVEHVDIDSDRSLLDADIILFRPGIPFSYRDYGQRPYQGKPTLGQSGSFKAVEHAKHWKSELKAAVEDGKTVVVFLAQPEEAFVYTGEQQFSGTGRNRQTTNIVAAFSSYHALPLRFEAVVPRRGREIRVASDLGPVAAYWREFGSMSPYEVYLEGQVGKPLLITKTGNKAVGAVVSAGKGHLLLLPPIKYDEQAFTMHEDDGTYWNDDGVAFGARLAAALIRLDGDLRQESGATPAPTWTSREEFRLTIEQTLEKEIESISAQLESLRVRRDVVSGELAAEGGIRRLLYAAGRELESAILEALRLLGYDAEALKEGESEFDAVFVSPEGDRYIGEAEGKETKPLNIDKLSQLERNIQEDFARDDVKQHARGVLFGNAYRLDDPDSRGEFFTEKCQSGARRSGIALVRTVDLFRVAQSLRDSPDANFAARCREAIRTRAGEIVVFPKPGEGNPSGGK